MVNDGTLPNQTHVLNSGMLTFHMMYNDCCWSCPRKAAGIGSSPKNKPGGWGHGKPGNFTKQQNWG